MRKILSVLSGLLVALSLMGAMVVISLPKDLARSFLGVRAAPQAKPAPPPPVDQVLEAVYVYLGPKLKGIAGRPVPAAVTRAISEALVRDARRAGFDPFFVVAVIEAESNFNVAVVSPTGARGLMQLLPSTFAEVSDSYSDGDPVDNVRAGIAYLASLYKGGNGFIRPESILRAYNGGPGTAMKYYQVARAKGDLSTFALEVREYPGKVLASYRRLVQAHGGDFKHPEKTWRKP